MRRATDLEVDAARDRREGRCGTRPAWRSMWRAAAAGVEVDVARGRRGGRCGARQVWRSMRRAADVEVDAARGRRGGRCCARPAWRSMRRAAGVEVDVARGRRGGRCGGDWQERLRLQGELLIKIRADRRGRLAWAACLLFLFEAGSRDTHNEDTKFRADVFHKY